MPGVATRQGCSATYLAARRRAVRPRPARARPTRAIEPGSGDAPVLEPNAVVRGLDPPRIDMVVAEAYELLHSAVAGLRENKVEIGEAFTGLRKTLKGTGEFFDKNVGCQQGHL